MKRFKNIGYFVLGMSILLTFSCEQEEKLNPIQTISNADIVTMLINNENININPDSLTSFVAQVDARSKVEEYNLRVSRVSGGQTSDTLAFDTYTSFPFTLNIDRAALASTFSIAVDDILLNDRFNFVGTSTTEDGTTYNIDDFNGNITGTPELQFNSDGYAFTIRIVDE